MYMTCKEEQIRVTAAPSCALVISNIVCHNYKLNHNALKHIKSNSYIVNITLLHRYNYFTSRYYVMEQRGGVLWIMDM